tara:strand:- start:451 stop:591 length:141 start_codon:yes stop_codon:yes gene_type:complete
MITLPAGFDPLVLMGEFFTLAAPFVGISFLIACGFLIVNYFKSIEF